MMKLLTLIKHVTPSATGKKKGSEDPHTRLGRICPYCHGTGYKSYTLIYPQQLPCDVCGGKRRIPY